MTPALRIRDLSVSFPAAGGRFIAVRGLSLTVAPGEVACIVGESGSGKSVAMMALMGLLPRQAKVAAARLELAGEDLLALPPRERARRNGGSMAMVFQEPMTSLNPCLTVGYQITETLAAHRGGPRRAHRDEAAALLARVGIPDPARRLRAFPHQFSGGMRQRVMIAMALAGRPGLLIADEPTTALDVTIQRQVLDLMRDLQAETGMAMVLITHDMGVVAEMADTVTVMRRGEVVEQSAADPLFAAPAHPYTRSLLAPLEAP